MLPYIVNVVFFIFELHDKFRNFLQQIIKYGLIINKITGSNPAPYGNKIVDKFRK